MRFSEWLYPILQDQPSFLSDWLQSCNWISCIQAIKHVIEGGSILMDTDTKRTWFKLYVLSDLNNHPLRPLIPVFEIPTALKSRLDQSENALVSDTLNLVYQSHILWYVGAFNTPMANLVLQERGLLWAFDSPPREEIMSFNSLDPLSDHQLLQLYRVFERMLLDALLGKVILA
ncbi:HobA family DNA replication regulator [Helicobacter suis]|uniref:HobA family DNA replication regulator n=1 Tax=Helicobacter suis TaxID=104628 RepID=UPI0013D3FA7A|nr:HobA family DNA replication regulator [Helicobacter suis]